MTNNNKKKKTKKGFKKNQEKANKRNYIRKGAKPKYKTKSGSTIKKQLKKKNICFDCGAVPATDTDLYL